MYSQSITSFKGDTLAFGPPEPSATGCFIHVHFIVFHHSSHDGCLFESNISWMKHMGGLGKENTSMPFGSSRALRRSVRFWICVLIYWILFWLLFSKRHAGFSLCSLSTPSFNHGPLGSADSFSCLSCLIYESRANKCIPARASSPVWEAKVVVPIF